FRVEWPDGVVQVLDDPYRFGTLAGEVDLWLFAEGTHARPDRLLGAHAANVEGVQGTRFVVWAPNAHRVVVVGGWNAWDEGRLPLGRRVEAGVWELFLHGDTPGARYKFTLIGAGGERLPWRADPYARETELRPATASVVPTGSPPPSAASRPARVDQPIAIY